MTVMNPTMVFRLVIAAQATALLPQALLAGLGLSGNEAALDAHMSFRGAILLGSAAQVIAAILLRRSGRIPRWPVVASIGLSVGYAVQMVAGRLQLFALRLPLGVALFGASIGLAIYAWAWRPVQIAELAGARAGAQRAVGREQAMISLLAALLVSAAMFTGAHNVKFSMLDGIGTALVGVALAVILTTIVTTMPLRLLGRFLLSGAAGVWVGLAAAIAGAGALSNPLTVLAMFGGPLVTTFVLVLAIPAARRGSSTRRTARHSEGPRIGKARSSAY